MFDDTNPHGLPMWTITSIALFNYTDGDPAWWFEMATKEGPTIVVGDVNQGPEVHVSGPGTETRTYRGEMAAERVAAFQKIWADLCAEVGVDPKEECMILLGRPATEPDAALGSVGDNKAARESL